MRSKKPTSTFLVDAPEEGDETEPADDFADIETFLADNDQSLEATGEEAVTEAEAAEALAASWKERRAEISRFKKDRRFDAAQHSRKSFRIDVEELKRRTKCRRCGRVGHWARECRSPCLQGLSVWSQAIIIVYDVGRRGAAGGTGSFPGSVRGGRLHGRARDHVRWHGPGGLRDGQDLLPG